MKKVVTLVVLVGCLAFGSSSIAQDVPADKKERVEKTPEEKAEKMTARMTEDLKLSEDQSRKVNDLNLAHIQEMEAVKVKMKALKAEAKLKRQAHEGEIDKILTDEQRTLHAEKMEERKAKRDAKKKKCDHEHDHGHGPE